MLNIKKKNWDRLKIIFEEKNQHWLKKKKKINFCILLHTMGFETWTSKPNNDISSFAKNVYFTFYFLNGAFGGLDSTFWLRFLGANPRDLFCTLLMFLLSINEFVNICGSCQLIASTFIISSKIKLILLDIVGKTIIMSSSKLNFRPGW